MAEAACRVSLSLVGPFLPTGFCPSGGKYRIQFGNHPGAKKEGRCAKYIIHHATNCKTTKQHKGLRGGRLPTTLSFVRASSFTRVAFARLELSHNNTTIILVPKKWWWGGRGVYRFLVRFAGSLLRNYPNTQHTLTDTTNACLVVVSCYNYTFRATPTRSLVNPYASTA